MGQRSRRDEAARRFEVVVVLLAAAAAMSSERPALAVPMVWHGEQPVAAPRVFNLLWNSFWDAHNPPELTTGKINGVTQSVMVSSYLDCANDYGVHRGSFTGSRDPSQGAAAICGLNPSATPNFADTIAWVTCMVGAPFWGFPSVTGVAWPDDDSIYSVYMPKGVVPADGGRKACVDYDAYHFITSVPKWKVWGIFPYLAAQRVPYTVVTTSCPNKPTGMSFVTENMSHELVEAATDPTPLPLPNTGWWGADPFHDEVSDACERASPPFVSLPNGIMVSAYWSNTALKCCPAACRGGETFCNGQCCAVGLECNAGVCCSPGHLVCSGACCPHAKDICHPSTQTCCMSGSTCGASCCTGFEEICVSPGAGRCCSRAHACGTSCCAANESCVKGACSSCGDCSGQGKECCFGQCCTFPMVCDADQHACVVAPG